MNIPFLDLITPHRELEDELVSVFRECLRNASFVGGVQTQDFEEEFARFCESKYAVAVNSGTDALRFALIAAGIGPGDEVITVPNTFIATTEAISQSGASIAFVDIDEKTYNMDPNKLEDYLKSRQSQGVSGRSQLKTRKNVRSSENRPFPVFHPRPSTLHPRIKAVLPVHLYGQPVDMDSILEIADRYGLILIEDACQAHGSLYHSKKDNRWKKAGSMGLAAGFSFYPGKNLGACGEGGAVTTHDEKIARKIRMLRDHGQSKKYYHDFEGYNGRLDTIQTGILRVKLKRLSEWNEKRRQNASFYTQLLSAPAPQRRSASQSPGTCRNRLVSESFTPDASRLAPRDSSIIVPFEPSWTKAVYHLYIVRVRHREKLQAYLTENGIATGLHYPIPLHLQKAYAGKGWKKGDFPVTEKVAKEILSLPMYPQLTKEQIEYVAEKIKQFFQKS